MHLQKILTRRANRAVERVKSPIGAGQVLRNKQVRLQKQGVI
jgi:hypothetical protein